MIFSYVIRLMIRYFFIFNVLLMVVIALSGDAIIKIIQFILFFAMGWIASKIDEDGKE